MQDEPDTHQVGPWPVGDNHIVTTQDELCQLML